MAERKPVLKQAFCLKFGIVCLNTISQGCSIKGVIRHLGFKHLLRLMLHVILFVEPLAIPLPESRRVRLQWRWSDYGMKLRLL